MAANFITTTGHTVQTPRFVATYINNRFGRRVVIRDNFPQLDGNDLDVMARDIEVIRLAPKDKVVPALAAAGFDLAGTWKARADHSACVKVARR